MQANSSGTGVGRLAEGSPAGTWGGERVPCPLLCRATGVDVSLMLTVLVPEASVASGLEEPVVDPECVSGPGGGWGWVSNWEADLRSPAWSMPHAGCSVARGARGAISSCSSPGPVCPVALLPWCSPRRPHRHPGPTAADAALAALMCLFLGGPLCLRSPDL